MDDLEFYHPNTDTNRRSAYRVKVAGLTLRMPRRDMANFPVVDISASGVSFKGPEGRFQWGEVFECDIMLGERVFISGLVAKAQRIFPGGVVGAAFVDLERRKEVKLDKLVLEAQKRLIALKKVQQDDDIDLTD